MTNISKNELPEAELNKLTNQFNKTLGNMTEKTAPRFLSELLGKEEKIMLTKRLCAVIMFMEGNSSYQVWQALHVSPTTANKIKLKFDCGQYKHIVTSLKSNRTDYENIWKILDVVLSAGLPPRGKGRWKSAFKN